MHGMMTPAFLVLSLTVVMANAMRHGDDPMDIYIYFFNSFGVSFREEKERIFLGYVFWDFREWERGGEGLKG